ncbi:MAG: hypothetical protein AAFX50_18975 [Acidobacteriota bacterium]
MTTAALESMLQNLEGLPVPVAGWEVETGEDHSGDEAVWVWVTLDDKDLDTTTRRSVRTIVRHKISELSKSWVYVRFRGASESLDP